MKNMLLFFSLLLTLLLYSCVSTQNITIDIMQPASVTLPPEIANLTIVDNAARIFTEPQSSNFRLNEQSPSSDSTKYLFVEKLFNKFAGEKFFRNVQIYPYEIRVDTAYFKENLLSSEQISSICKETDANALLSIDNFAITNSVEYLGRFKEIALCILSKIRLYKPDGKLISNPILLNDTLYWSELDFSSNPDYPTVQPLPTLREALTELYDSGSGVIVRQFVPYWTTVDRVYFSNKQTNSLIQNNKWEEARNIWKAIYDKEKEQSRIKRSRLAFNIALSYECTDDLESARNWIEKANELLPDNVSDNMKKHFVFYSKVLKERQKLQKKLEQQIGG